MSWSELKMEMDSMVGTKTVPLDEMMDEMKMEIKNILFGGEVEYTEPGTYTFVVPDNVRSLMMDAAGGGGGGGYGVSNSEWYGGGGGGGGACIRGHVLPVTPGETLTIMVGKGGAAGAYHSSTSNAALLGKNGESTIIQNRVTISGGGGGSGYNSSNSREQIFGGAGGSTSGGAGGRWGNAGQASDYASGGGDPLISSNYSAGSGGGSLGIGGIGASYCAAPHSEQASLSELEKYYASSGEKGGGGGGSTGHYRVNNQLTRVVTLPAKGGDGYVKLAWGSI